MSIAKNPPAKSFRDLRVWNAAIQLVKEIYGVTQGFPSSELYGLTSQMRRAAVSIPSNIAEGYTREHRKEYLQFLAIAQASLAELDTHLEIAQQLGFVRDKDLSAVTGSKIKVGKQLRSLRKALADRYRFK